MGDNLVASEILGAGLTRKQLAEMANIEYTTLTNRMCGFLRWPDGELKRIRKILAEHIKKLSATRK